VRGVTRVELFRESQAKSMCFRASHVLKVTPTVWASDHREKPDEIEKLVTFSDRQRVLSGHQLVKPAGQRCDGGNQFVAFSAGR